MKVIPAAALVRYQHDLAPPRPRQRDDLHAAAVQVDDLGGDDDEHGGGGGEPLAAARHRILPLQADGHAGGAQDRVRLRAGGARRRRHHPEG